MFVIQNIKLCSPLPIFETYYQRWIRTQTDRCVKKTKLASKRLNAHEIYWDQQLEFDFRFYNELIHLEVYQKHEHGYRQQQLLNIFWGKIKITQNDLSLTAKLTTNNQQKLFVSLTAKIRHNLQIKSKTNQSKYNFVVRSIVGHLPISVNRNIIFNFSIDNQHSHTPQIFTQSGEIVFAKQISLMNINRLEKLNIQLMQKRQDSIIKLGEGSIRLSQQLLIKRVFLKTQNARLLGEIFIDYQIRKIENKVQSISRSLHRVLSKSKSDYQDKAQTNFKLISILNSNQGVVFGKAKRFSENNPQVKIISQSQSFYSKAKKQTKSKFKNTSEVERYILPTIWDNYE